MRFFSKESDFFRNGDINNRFHGDKCENPGNFVIVDSNISVLNFAYFLPLVSGYLVDVSNVYGSN